MKKILLVVSLLCMALSPFIPVWMDAEEAVRGPASEYFFISRSAADSVAFASTLLADNPGTVIELISPPNTQTPVITASAAKVFFTIVPASS